MSLENLDASATVDERRILYPAVYLAVAAAAMSIQVVGARQNAVQIDPDDIGGVVTSTQGTRGRRLGHRRDQGSADGVQPQRRHRRSRPLRRPRSAEGELPGLRPRLRAGRTRRSRPGRARQAAESDGDDRARARKTPRSTTRRTTGSRCSTSLRRASFRSRSREPRQAAQPGGVSQTAQDRRLHVVPSARQQANPRNQPGASGSSSHPQPRGPSA